MAEKQIPNPEFSPSLSQYFLLNTFTHLPQEKPAFRLLDAQAQPISYATAMQEMAQADIVLFGEIHNVGICHWLCLEMLSDLFQQKGADGLQVGMEMFEQDQQHLLHQWITGELTDEAFRSAGRLWNNFDTDYLPLLDFCKIHHLPCFATHAPRPYARRVAQTGLSSLELLEPHEKAWIAPLPFPIDDSQRTYQKILEMAQHPHMPGNARFFLEAQAIKDATMAHHILKFREPGKTFFHLNGTFHADFREGIVWYLRHWQPEVRICTLSTTMGKDLKEVPPDAPGKGDLLLWVPANTSRTFV